VQSFRKENTNLLPHKNHETKFDVYTTKNFNSNIGIQKNSLSIYPNPTTGAFVIQRLSAESCSIVIQDMMGRIIFKKDNISDKEIQFNLSEQAEGVYMMKVQTGDKTDIRKVIKN
jgi:hypothetical protein